MAFNKAVRGRIAAFFANATPEQASDPMLK
jgi:hypothetical protein